VEGALQKAGYEDRAKKVDEICDGLWRTAEHSWSAEREMKKKGFLPTEKYDR
jgi:hypothetical protein